MDCDIHPPKRLKKRSLKPQSMRSHERIKSDGTPERWQLVRHHDEDGWSNLQVPRSVSGFSCSHFLHHHGIKCRIGGPLSRKSKRPDWGGRATSVGQIASRCRYRHSSLLKIIIKQIAHKYNNRVYTKRLVRWRTFGGKYELSCFLLTCLASIRRPSFTVLAVAAWRCTNKVNRTI